ncbi:MAG: transcription antitermination factor NusB [Rhodospirillaceae bacterium]|jgi:N utilization substance protein B|nr:transcription antitermination factor NusB [Rhodospirillaceae bacterium]MBT4044386.1 transcription antitermination factor NusB [Rhodospirillaceae bacterium]MBT4686453.1 transcription antitermination factor NusB [Rhodospirillaceae bacterium]MBT5080122.1 transcription antitermination factor NusB [Rhodospirillaceae bacterium]MBT5526422.1 transcription antitermination factor NusB [Rhodospirillaceae bacterium]
MTDSAGAKGGKKTSSGALRRGSRLAAVQALYQLSLSGDAADDTADEIVVEDAIIEFLAHRPGAELPEDAYAEVDGDLFSDLVRGARRHQVGLIKVLDAALPTRWRFERLDRILAEVLGCAAYEMKYRPDVPVAVIINEYVEITKAFYEGKEGGFINGILQEVAQGLRGDEVLEHRNERAKTT